METRTEEWRAVAGYEGLYEVSNLGRVKSLQRRVWSINNGVRCLRTINERILRPYKNKFGYLLVVICKDGTKSHVQVHRLVAMAFVPGYFVGAQVNHKDECKTNNQASNLEWITPQGNSTYGTRISRVVESQRNKTPIRCTTLDGTFVGEYTDARDAGEKLGLKHVNILRVAQGRRKHHFGYVFTFVAKPTAEGEQDAADDTQQGGNTGNNQGGTTGGNEHGDLEP